VKKFRLAAAAAGVTLALVASACGSTPTPSSGSNNNSSSGTSGSTSNSGTSSTKTGSSDALTISNESGSLWTCGFNPFNPSVNDTSVGFIYEPLVFVDALENEKTTPWLATSYAWGAGNKSLTFTIRKGVKFSDGSALTAADVAFTFNLLKKFPALDLNSIWSVLSSVTQKGDDVVLDFKSAAVPYFYYVADQVPIVPEAIWSKVKNPVTYLDSKPVGSGPYTVSQCTGQNIQYTSNSAFWHGAPKVKTVNYPAFTSNDPANTELATGEAQWGGQFIPNVQSFYTAKSPNYHYWYPSIANVSMFINLKDPQLDDVNVRKAMAYAVNRSQVSNIGEYGYEAPSNQTGIVTPTFNAWLDKADAAKYDYTFNTAKAEQILESDGYKKGSDGIFAKDGKALSFNVINVGGNSDWVAALQVIQQNMKAAGIKISVSEESGTDYDNNLYKGEFQLAYGTESGGPSPYYELRQLLDSHNSAAIGQLAATNYERYSDPATDALFDDYASTTSVATQHSIVDQLEKVMLSDVPVIPMTEAAEWYQYDTSNFTGWETSSDPFAIPAPYAYPDDEQVLLRLSPK
jgi:peptide/nickel transport system substrate-binding protein